jgi:hypothetical protein
VAARGGLSHCASPFPDYTLPDSPAIVTSNWTVRIIS